jgi:multicomponent K+:H+ antiporter subunit C
MEIVYALAVGVLVSCGVWLVMRPRTFQVIIGLSLLSYAVNLFILAMGRLKVDKPPIITADGASDLTLYADPVPQALVLTAIVISFATTALFLVVLLAARGMTGTDHVDGRDGDS